MEQVKFRTLPIKSHSKKYIFNKVVKTKGDSEQTVTNFTTPYQNLPNNLRNESFSSVSMRKNQSRKRILVKTAKAQAINRNLMKQTLKKLRKVNTQQNRSSELETRGVKHLKDYIRSITKICNKIQKSKAERAQAMHSKYKDQTQQVSHLSFSEIQQEKIEKQKQYLTNFQHLGRCKSKLINTASSGKQKTIGQSLIIIYRMIDRLYEILEQMQQLGYYKKNNKNIINFCTNTKIWLFKVFLVESSSHKDAFSIKTQWLVVPTADEAKENLSNYITKGGKIDFRIINNDIEELVGYLQQSLGQKKLIQISKLGDYIQTRIKDSQFQQGGKQNLKILRVFKSKPDQFNFSNELSQLEERYGSMNIVTKVSRHRFQDLNRTYDKLKSLL